MAPLFTGSKLGVFKKGFPNITTNGLILRLDPAFQESYAGIGTNYYDISGSNNNNLLYNGTTYNRLNEGVLGFDGVNDKATSITTSLVISNSFTISAWIYHNSLPSSIMRYVTIGNEVGVIRYDGAQGSGQLHFYIKVNSSLSHIRINNSLAINQWYYVAGTWDGTTQKLYKNNSLIGSASPAGALNGGNLEYIISSDSEALNGYIGEVCAYNRALSVDEIQRNFENLRGRYKI